MTDSFVLDPRLQQDTVFIIALPLSDLRLMNDRCWPWLVLVPRLTGAEEIHRLDTRDQQQLYTEISRVAATLQEETGCDKINTGALGNIVRQLHVHIIARNAGDANWPGPVWGFGQPQPYEKQHLEALIRCFQMLFDKKTE